MPHEGNRRARGAAPPILAAPVLQLQLLDFEDFLFFGPRGLVDFVHVGVGQLLDLVVGPLVLVFGDLLVLDRKSTRLNSSLFPYTTLFRSISFSLVRAAWSILSM